MRNILLLWVLLVVLLEVVAGARRLDSTRYKERVQARLLQSHPNQIEACTLLANNITKITYNVARILQAFAEIVRPSLDSECVPSAARSSPFTAALQRSNNDQEVIVASLAIDSDGQFGIGFNSKAVTSLDRAALTQPDLSLPSHQAIWYFFQRLRDNGIPFEVTHGHRQRFQQQHPAVPQIQPKPQFGCAEHQAISHLESMQPILMLTLQINITIEARRNRKVIVRKRCPNCHSYGTRMGPSPHDGCFDHVRNQFFLKDGMELDLPCLNEFLPVPDAYLDFSDVQVNGDDMSETLAGGFPIATCPIIRGRGLGQVRCPLAGTQAGCADCHATMNRGR